MLDRLDSSFDPSAARYVTDERLINLEFVKRIAGYQSSNAVRSPSAQLVQSRECLGAVRKENRLGDSSSGWPQKILKPRAPATISIFKPISSAIRMTPRLRSMPAMTANLGLRQIVQCPSRAT